MTHSGHPNSAPPEIGIPWPPQVYHLALATKMLLGYGGANMPLINIVVALIIVGVGLYLINRYIPMASSIKSILNVVVVVVVLMWVLQAFGLWNGISTFRVGR